MSTLINLDEHRRAAGEAVVSGERFHIAVTEEATYVELARRAGGAAGNAPMTTPSTVRRPAASFRKRRPSRWRQRSSRRLYVGLFLLAAIIMSGVIVELVSHPYVE
jgi:hypothetical protein